MKRVGPNFVRNNTKCVVKFCENLKYAETNRKHMYTFPVKNFKRCEAWVKFCDDDGIWDNFENDIPKLRNKVICEDHFLTQDFYNSNERRRLLINAVPSVHRVPEAVSSSVNIIALGHDYFGQKREIRNESSAAAITTTDTVSANQCRSKQSNQSDFQEKLLLALAPVGPVKTFESSGSVRTYSRSSPNVENKEPEPEPEAEADLINKQLYHLKQRKDKPSATATLTSLDTQAGTSGVHVPGVHVIECILPDNALETDLRGVLSSPSSETSTSNRSNPIEHIPSPTQVTDDADRVELKRGHQEKSPDFRLLMTKLRKTQLVLASTRYRLSKLKARETLSKRETLIAVNKIGKNMNPVAAEFVRSQFLISSGLKSEKSGWSKEMKEFTLSILRRSPPVFRKLSKIFHMPSKTTIDRYKKELKKAEADAKVADVAIAAAPSICESLPSEMLFMLDDVLVE